MARRVDCLILLKCPAKQGAEVLHHERNSDKSLKYKAYSASFPLLARFVEKG